MRVKSENSRNLGKSYSTQNRGHFGICITISQQKIYQKTCDNCYNACKTKVTLLGVRIGLLCEEEVGTPCGTGSKGHLGGSVSISSR